MSASATPPPPRQQHKSVGAPIKAVPLDLIPPTNGSVAVLPEDNPTTADFKSALQEKVPELKLAPLSKDTTGVVWLDIAGPPAAKRLDDVLDQYPQIGWVQLPQAGINNFAAVVKKYNKKVWTSAKVSERVHRYHLSPAFLTSALFLSSSGILRATSR